MREWRRETGGDDERVAERERERERETGGDSDERGAERGGERERMGALVMYSVMHVFTLTRLRRLEPIWLFVSGASMTRQITSYWPTSSPPYDGWADPKLSLLL